MNDKKQEIGGDFNGQFINGDVNNNHHHYNPPGSITFNFLSQPAATGISPEVGNLLTTYSKPRNEHGFSASQPIILGQSAPLTTEQRRALNDKVKLLESNFGQSGRETWQTLHRTMGTANINEMTQQHYGAAETLLDNRLAIAGLESQLATQQQQANEHAGTLQNLQQEIQGLTQQNKKLRNKYQGLIEDHQESQSRQASEHASALRKLKEENLRLEAEVERQRKKVPRPCPDCHDKESRLVSTQHRLMAMAGAALCGFFTAGYFALLG